MIRIRTFYIFLIIALITIRGLSGETIPGRILIKFEAGSELYSRMLAGGFTNEIDEFSFVLGDHKIYPFIKPELISWLKTYENISFYKGGKRSSEELSRIFVIEYSSPSSPAIAAGKISFIEGIEYSEAVPRHKVFSIPNDPDLIRQYHHDQIQDYDAWDHVEVTRQILIGIVDTGIDYNHDDLAQNIFTNPGETGIDNDGNDRRTNGIDDDNNGFTDDWRGWDFVSSLTESGEDNDPRPGNEHGSHVAGIAAAVINNNIGGAGVAVGTKLLAVKIGADNSLSTSVEESYNGILYAALMGADIINCSWGSNSKSEAEQEVLDVVVGMGALVIGAAGNDGVETSFFPAAYKGAMSVAAVKESDKISFFSNYDYSVDISAPGQSIYSTTVDNSYGVKSGTSMAAPVVAGAAALVMHKFPGYSHIQVIEQLKATSEDIDLLNYEYKNKIGKGRVNALRAVTNDTAISVVLEDYRIVDEIDDGILNENENAYMNIELTNILFPLTDGYLKASSGSIYSPEFTTDSLWLGDFSTMESRAYEEALVFTIPEGVPLDYTMVIVLEFYDNNGFITKETVDFIVKPSYKTMDRNNLSVTFNSIGNIAYNDYPENRQGDGFKYKSSSSLLYEGALMIGVSEQRISNVARSHSQSFQERSFTPVDIFNTSVGGIAALEGSTRFESPNDSLTVGLEVYQKVYQFDEPGKQDFIFISYDIINKTGGFIDSLYAALYFDWDLSPSGKDNKVYFDNNAVFGFIKHAYDTKIPMVGAMLLSRQKLNYFAMDNNGNSIDNPGVYNGFSRVEKWKTMTGGIARRESNLTDASMVIGAGPVRMRAGDTTRVTFSLFAGTNIDELREIANVSRTTAKEFNIADGDYSYLPYLDSLRIIYPNPVYDNSMTVEYGIADKTELSIDIYDILGNWVSTLIKNEITEPNFYTRVFDISQLSQGRYYIRFKSGSLIQYEPFNVVR